MRSLQEENKNISCFIQNEVNENCVKYKCEVHGDTSGINSIAIKEPEFNNFNVKLSPISLEQMSNLTKNINNQTLYNLENKKIYILNDASYSINGNSLLISGAINDKDNNPSFDNDSELFLFVKELPDNTTAKLNCFVRKTEYKNQCSLLCELNSKAEYDLDTSVLIDDDKAIIINFQNGTKSQVTSITDTRNRRYYKRSSNGLSKGLIALIVIIPVVLVAIIAGLILFFRKPSNNPQIPVPTASTTEKIRGN